MADLDAAIARLTKVGLLAESPSGATIVGGRSATPVRLPGLEGKIYHDRFKISCQQDTWTAIVEGPGMYHTVLQTTGTLDQAVAVVCELYPPVSPTESSEEIDGQQAVQLLKNRGLFAELFSSLSGVEIFGGTQVVGEGQFRDYQSLFGIYRPYGPWVVVVRTTSEFKLIAMLATLAEAVEVLCSSFSNDHM